MQFSLIICTYQRPQALLDLLNSIKLQNRYPNQIIIVDGSRDGRIRTLLQQNHFSSLEYFQVGEKDRGLTRQRNFGVNKVSLSSEIICFLDDDIILTPFYFENLVGTYLKFPEAVGVGGFIIDDVRWKRMKENKKNDSSYFSIDGFYRKDSSRFILRKKLGLMPNTFPTYMPEEGHGRSVGFLPPSGKTYQVETFMGGVSSYRKSIFEQMNFSSFFEGYGLYEDTEFTLRLSRIGKLYINTAAQLYHNHHEDGRPNQFEFGKMVVRNGWYVWRVKNSSPAFKVNLRWHLVTIILILIRISNVFTTSQKKQALTESLGRIYGWISVIINKPNGRENDQKSF